MVPRVTIFPGNDPTRGPRSLYIFIYFYFRTQNYIKFSSSFYVPSYGMHAYRPFCILKDIIYVVSRDRIDQCRRESYLRPYIESYRIIEYLFSCFWNKLLHDSIWYWLTHFFSHYVSISSPSHCVSLLNSIFSFTVKYAGLLRLLEKVLEFTI